MTKNILLTAAMFVVGLASASDAKADTYHHIDQLAYKAKRYSQLLYHEFRYHYRHTPEYHHLISDASQMYRLADHIHEVAHHHGSVFHLENDVRKLDRLFHHLEDLLDEIEHDAHFGHGHVHGHTSHVHSYMRYMENVIHHLQDDLRELTAPPIHDHHDHHGHHHGIGIRFRIR